MITLVLGGARSGKSALAERLAEAAVAADGAVASEDAPVTYVATGRAGDDADMAARIEAHRRRRPTSWQTVEAGLDLPDVLRRIAGTVLVDALGTWIAGAPDLAVPVGDLCAALAQRQGSTVVVSDEVGLGVHPSSEIGRRFRDALGECNHAVAEVSDEVLLVIAGRVLPLERR